MVRTQRISEDHPIVRAIDDQTRAKISDLCEQLKMHPVYVAVCMLSLIGRQCALLDVSQAAALFHAIGDEIASEYDAEPPRLRRIAAVEVLTARSDAVARELIAEAEEARASGRVS